MPGFHDKTFDDGTLAKLAVFRGYIRAWIPVAMGDEHVKRVRIFDFFAGPGSDANGQPGSPLIIVEEVRKFCEKHGPPRDGTRVSLYFNDKNPGNIATLEQKVSHATCGEACCDPPRFRVRPFAQAFEEELPSLGRQGEANLVVMDQFGFKEVTPDVVRKLADCNFTDFLFFLSSSTLRRFAESPEVQRYIPLDSTEIRNVPYEETHRFMCKYMRSQVSREDYFMAPFSISKGANIYGLVFGSRHLYALEKFLDVCWKEDPITGERSQPFGDGQGGNQLMLGHEFAITTKERVFEAALGEYLQSRSPDNHELNHFCLEEGFCPAKAREVLKRLQAQRLLETVSLTGVEKPKKGAFYLGWRNCKPSVEPRIRIEWRGE